MGWFVVVEGRAQPAPGEPALTLSPGVTCLQQRTLEESLDAALDRRLDSTGLTVRVQGSTHDRRTAVIRLFRAPPQNRALSAPDEVPLAERAFSPGPPRCVDFQHAIALAIAMMINNAERAQPTEIEPLGETITTEPRALPVPATPPSRVPTVDEDTHEADLTARRPHAVPLRIAPIPRSRAEPPRASRDPRKGAHDDPARESYWRAQAALALGVQVGPPRTRGLTADVAFAGSRLALALGVLSLFSTEAELRRSALHYQTRPLAGSFALALRLFSTSSLTLRLSLGFLAGRMRTTLEDRGREATRPQRIRWFAGKAALELAVPLGASLRLALSGGPLWSIRRLGVSALRDDESQEILDRQVFKPVGALFALGLAYERRIGESRQGSEMRRHAQP